LGENHNIKTNTEAVLDAITAPHLGYYEDGMIVSSHTRVSDRAWIISGFMWQLRMVGCMLIRSEGTSGMSQ
jgi:hypothetical protein